MTETCLTQDANQYKEAKCVVQYVREGGPRVREIRGGRCVTIGSSNANSPGISGNNPIVLLRRKRHGQSDEQRGRAEPAEQPRLAELRGDDQSRQPRVGRRADRCGGARREGREGGMMDLAVDNYNQTVEWGGGRPHPAARQVGRGPCAVRTVRRWTRSTDSRRSENSRTRSSSGRVQDTSAR